MPEDTDTYLHRVARAGRFGTKVGHLHFTLILKIDFEDIGCGGLERFSKISE